MPCCFAGQLTGKAASDVAVILMLAAVLRRDKATALTPGLTTRHQPFGPDIARSVLAITDVGCAVYLVAGAVAMDVAEGVGRPPVRLVAIVVSAIPSPD